MEIIIPDSAPPIRLKTALKQYGLSDRYWKKLKTAGLVSVNGEVQRRDLLLRAGDRIAWDFLPEVTSLLPEEAPLEILYEDEALLAVNKPAGLLTHNPGRERISALSRRVAWHYMRTGVKAAVHPVSRLDKETSGLVLFAKNAFWHHRLSSLSLQKSYLGLTEGLWTETSGLLGWPIGRRPGSLIERQVDLENGQPARTKYRVLAAGSSASLVLFTLETGRTHQIRVHCAAAGHALVGDNLYGTPGPPSRHFLHAWQLHLTHPLTGRELVITAPLPEDMRAAISRLIRPGGGR